MLECGHPARCFMEKAMPSPSPKRCSGAERPASDKLRCHQVRPNAGRGWALRMPPATSGCSSANGARVRLRARERGEPLVQDKAPRAQRGPRTHSPNVPRSLTHESTVFPHRLLLCRPLDNPRDGGMVRALLPAKAPALRELHSEQLRGSRAPHPPPCFLQKRYRAGGHPERPCMSLTR